MKKLKIKKGLMIQRHFDKISIYDSSNTMLYTFNNIGAFILTSILDNLEEKKTVESIAGNYEVSLDKANKDYQEFIQRLKKENIIE